MAKKLTRKEKQEQDRVDLGRPSLYTEALGLKICDAISITNKSLATICKQNKDFPCEKTIRSWIVNESTFLHNYKIAKAQQADFMAESMIDIIQNAREDVLTRKVPNFKASAYMSAIRMEIDVMKFHASKLKPKVYGDKLDLTSDGEKIQANIEWLGVPPKKK